MKKQYKKTALWVFLWIIAGVILVPLFKPFLVGYNVITILVRTYITKRYLRGTLTYYFKRMAISDDKNANVYGNDALNDFMLKKDAPRYFGFLDETISSPTGKAARRDHLGKRGEKIDEMLEFFEEGHSEKSIEEDEGIGID
jgi:hypothetical protein